MSKASDGRKHSRKHRSIQNLRSTVDPSQRSSISSLAAEYSPSPPPSPAAEPSRRHSKTHSAKSLKDNVSKLPPFVPPLATGRLDSTSMLSLKLPVDADTSADANDRRRRAVTDAPPTARRSAAPPPTAVDFQRPAAAAAAAKAAPPTGDRPVFVLLPAFTVAAALTDDQVIAQLRHTLGIVQRPVLVPAAADNDNRLVFSVPDSSFSLHAVQDNLCTIHDLGSELARARAALLALAQQHEADLATITALQKTSVAVPPIQLPSSSSSSSSSLSTAAVTPPSDSNDEQAWKDKYEAERQRTTELRSLINSLEARLHLLEAVSTPRPSPRTQPPEVDSGSRFECKFPGCRCDHFQAKHSAHWVCERCTHLLVVHERH